MDIKLRLISYTWWSVNNEYLIIDHGCWLTNNLFIYFKDIQQGIFKMPYNE